MEPYYLISSHTQDKFIQNDTSLDKICICCSSQNVNFVNLSTCKHTTFLKNITKVKLKLQKSYVCMTCHNMLMKIEAFRQQVEDTNNILSKRAYKTKINAVQNLHCSSVTMFDSTQPSHEADDIEVKPEVHDIEFIEEDAGVEEDTAVEEDTEICNMDIKVEHDYSAPEPERPKKKREKTNTGSKYKGKIRVVLLTFKELNEERQSMAKEEKYLTLPYKCESCIIGFDHELTWTAHMEQRHTMRKGGFRCQICKSVLNTKSSYNDHTKRHLRRLECVACGKRYKDIQPAVQHYDEKHMPAGSSLQRAYKCNCGFTTTVNRVFRYHQDKHKEKQACTICGNTFVNTNSLKIHMFTVHGQSSRVYRCDVCNKCYRAKSGLTTHVRAVHAAAPAAYCAPCRTHYTTIYGLQAHLATHSRHVTDTNKKFTCDYCGAKFVKKCNLQVHINWEHLKLEVHRCSTCNKEFKCAAAVRRHTKYVHNKHRPPRDKICHYCGRDFTTQTILKSHLRIHTGERPLQCQQCQDTFAHSGALYTHIKLKHNVEERVSCPSNTKAGSSYQAR